MSLIVTIAPLLLFCISAVVCDDVSCLNGLKASMESGAGKLNEWTPLLLAKPCDTATSSKLNGIGCNGNRVISIVLNFFDLSVGSVMLVVLYHGLGVLVLKAFLF